MSRPWGAPSDRDVLGAVDGLADVLAEVRGEVLAAYVRRLVHMRSPLLGSDIARAQCMEHAAEILADVEASLRAGYSCAANDPKRLARRIGATRAADGIHPSESLRAASELFEATLTALAAAASASVTPAATATLAVALNATIGRQVQEAASSYGGFMLERVRDAYAEERRRIARDIHDRVAQNVVAADRSLELFQAETPYREDRRIVTARAALSETIRSIRQVTVDLRLMRPVEGLELALRVYLEALAPDGIDQSILVNGDDARLTSVVRDQVFLVLCEAIRNAVSHARPASLRVRVNITPCELRATVDDDGIGLDMTRSADCHGSGLVSMRERAELLGGTFVVSTAPGSGTRVELLIPLERQSHGETE